MSLPSLNEIIDAIIRNKELLRRTIKKNLSLGKTAILDISQTCKLCSKAKTSVVWFDFDTLMGQLSVMICSECHTSCITEAKREKELESLEDKADRLEEHVRKLQTKGSETRT